MTTPKPDFSPALRPSAHRTPTSASQPRSPLSLTTPLVRTPTIHVSRDEYFPPEPREEEPAGERIGPRRRWGQTVYSLSHPPTFWGGVKKAWGRMVDCIARR